MIVCADSSFVASLYAQEEHSAEADRRMGTGVSVYLTPMNRVELAHAFSLQVFRARFTERRARALWQQFAQDCLHGVWLEVDLPDRAWQTCIDLAHRYGPTLGVRTLDSLHVASALELGAEKFWTFDERQARLAEAVGLAVSA